MIFKLIPDYSEGLSDVKNIQRINGLVIFPRCGVLKCKYSQNLNINGCIK